MCVCLDWLKSSKSTLDQEKHPLDLTLLKHVIASSPHSKPYLTPHILPHNDTILPHNDTILPQTEVGWSLSMVVVGREGAKN